MLQDAHTAKTSISVTANAGATTEVVAAQDDAWIYIHELIGDLAADGTLVIKCGSDTVATFNLDAGQGITLQDEAGHDGVPRFKCKPGDAFSLTVTGGNFVGSCDYSLRY